MHNLTFPSVSIGTQPAFTPEKQVSVGVLLNTNATITPEPQSNGK